MTNESATPGEVRSSDQLGAIRHPWGGNYNTTQREVIALLRELGPLTARMIRRRISQISSNGRRAAGILGCELKSLEAAGVVVRVDGEIPIVWALAPNVRAERASAEQEKR